MSEAEMLELLLKEIIKMEWQLRDVKDRCQRMLFEAKNKDQLTLVEIESE